MFSSKTKGWRTRKDAIKGEIISNLLVDTESNSLYSVRRMESTKINFAERLSSLLVRV
jgi:hypothetical protein